MGKLEDGKKKNIFVRLLVVGMVVFLLAMVAYVFYMPGDDHAKITGGLVTLLCLAIILCLSEAFDNFSIAKIFQVSRDLKKKGEEADRLEDRNNKLFDSLISIVSTTQNQAQAQNSTIVQGDYHAAPVRPATDQEIAAAAEDKVEPTRPDSVAGGATEDGRVAAAVAGRLNVAPEEAHTRKIDWRKLENLAIEKHSTKFSSRSLLVMYDVKLVSQFSGVDPISDEMPVFDGFAKDGDREIFMEVRNSRAFGPGFRSNLYLKLSKIYHYRASRRVDAYLDLLLVNSSFDNYSEYSQERLYRDFSPALSSGLLRIYKIDFTDDDIEACVKQVA